METVTHEAEAVSEVHAGELVAPGVTQMQTVMVNLFFVSDPVSGEWMLVDAGIPGFAPTIIEAAEKLFEGRPPKGIVLTHGHFDHVGSLEALLEVWDVPVYAHKLELPYLTGLSKYPPPDPTVGGGIMPRFSPLFSRGPIDLGDRVKVLPEDGTTPFIPGWKWIHTPGHTPGHVSLWREEDGTLIAGDAFITQRQESFFSVMTNAHEMHGPPMYFTSDWGQAANSVQRLAELQPEHAGVGHGLPMKGEKLRKELRALADHFIEIAVPEDGRYVREPARADETGVTYIPKAIFDPVPLILGVSAGAVLGYCIVSMMSDRPDKKKGD